MDEHWTRTSRYRFDALLLSRQESAEEEPLMLSVFIKQVYLMRYATENLRQRLTELVV